jgi:SAM-dependent methyltransferase
VTVAQPSLAGAADAAAKALSMRLFRAMLATQESFAAYLGVKLGLYQALHDAGSASAAELAERTGLSRRYLREWLEQQAVAGLLAVDDASPPPEERAYRIPLGYERVLTASADPLSMVSVAMLPLGGVAKALPSLLEAFRTGGGVPVDAFGEDWRQGHGGANRFLYDTQLAGWLRRYLPDVHRRLASGPARAVDVGCGAGWAAIALATAYPAIMVSGFDIDEAVVAQASDRARQAGVGERVSFAVTDAAMMADAAGTVELVLLLDTLHELARPVEALRACRRLCSGSGVVVVLESRIPDDSRTPGDEIERFQYATSVLHCLPAALVGEDAVGTGTVMRAAIVRRYAVEAGLLTCRSIDLDDRFHRLYLLS